MRAGGGVTNDELMRFASLFKDELTLDNLDRVQLVSMCQLLAIPPYGTDAFLRGRLRAHLGALKQDDRLIQAEGLDSLTDDELRTAVKARGMKAAFGEGAGAFMRRQMQAREGGGSQRPAGRSAACPHHLSLCLRRAGWT